MSQKKNIFAIATPVGKSAIAVIRLSGPDVINIIKSISSNMSLESNKATLNTIYTNKGEPIDQTITTIFKEPNSYTGENMVEISTHGGSAIIKKTINQLTQAINCRLAEPGEFTRRAFINNKLDLTQVEAIADLVNSETEAQRKQAFNQLGGVLSNKIKKWSDRIIKILADVEATIDFTEEDLPNNLIIKIKEHIANIIFEISSFIDDDFLGEKIRSGFIVSIIGNPNVGKSSLINYISKRDFAIVTNEPGTTRDILELYFDYKGIPIKFYDTAGIRKSKNLAENIGIQKTINLSKEADINLILIESNQDFETYKNYPNTLFVQSKIDISQKIVSSHKIYFISSISSVGIDDLLEKIYEILSKNIYLENINVSRERHRTILKNTLNYLITSRENKNIDIFAEDIRLAHKEITKIYGKNDIDDILEIIFSDFCIGK